MWHTIKPETPEQGKMECVTNTDRTAEHPATVVEQWNTLEHLRIQWSTNVTPAEQPGTTEPYRTIQNEEQL